MALQQQIQALQTKLQNALDAGIEELERKTLRPLQRDTHLKLSQCYGAKNASSEDVSRCVEVQSRLQQAVNNAINAEIETFQNRYQRCMNGCQDDFQSANYDNRSGVPSEDSQRRVVSCVSTCVDKHISLLKPMISKVEHDINDLNRQVNK